MTARPCRKQAMETDVKITHAIKIVAFATLTVVSGAGHALEWSDNQVYFQAGQRFAEPEIPAPIQRRVYGFVHLSGDKLGVNLIDGQILESDGVDPAAGNGHGAQAFAGLLRRTLSLSSVSGRGVRLGPVKDVSLALRIERDTKNTAVARSKRATALGLAFDLQMPAGWAVVNLYAYSEKTYNSVAAREVRFDTTPMLHTAWSVPFTLGRPVSFDGDFTVIAPKGKDGLGNGTKTEIRFHGELLTEVGQDTGLLVGVGYERWRNKYGANASVTPGARQNTALLVGHYYF